MPRFTDATHCSLSDLGHAAATLEELLKTAHDAGAEAHDQSTSRLTAHYQVTGAARPLQCSALFVGG